MPSILTTEYLSSDVGKVGLPTHVPGEGRGVTADLVSSPKAADGPANRDPRRHRCIADHRRQTRRLPQPM